MPNFTFRLEKILQLKKKIEDQRKKELVDLKELLRKEQDFLKKLEAVIAHIQGIRKDSQKEILNMNEILDYYHYLSCLREKAIAQISLIEELIRSTEEKRKELIAASKERKMIEKLKDNQLREFRTALEKLEVKLLDELATTGYTHRSKYGRS